MDHVTGDIQRALDERLWVIALQASMAAIDICGGLSTPNGEASGAAFRAWCDKWFPDSPLTSDDLYSLRCGILHQGRTSGRRYVAVAFSVRDDSENIAIGNVMDGVLNLDLVDFCETICRKIDYWWHVTKDDEPIRSNARFLVRERDDALAPYIRGIRGLAPEPDVRRPW